MPELTKEEQQALINLLKSSVIANEMGAENWDLSEEEETHIWAIIKRLP